MAVALQWHRRMRLSLGLAAAALALALAGITTAHAAPAVCANGWYSAAALLAPHAGKFNQASDSTCLRIQGCVNYDAATTQFVDTLLVEGSLRFTDGANRTLNARRIYVFGPASDLADPAELIVGTEAAPFQSVAKITLASRGIANCTQEVVISPTGVVTVGAVNPAADPYHPDGTPDEAKLAPRLLYARGRVNLELHGHTREATWKLLLATIGPTNVTPAPLTLSFQTTPTWTTGDEVVVATTDYDLAQTERKTISAPPTRLIPGLPLWLVPMNSIFTYYHRAGQVGDPVSPTIIESAEVGLLTHNVKIFTPVTDLGTPAVADTCTAAGVPLFFDGAEVRIERDANHAPTVHIEQIEMSNAGKFGVLGHYPIHFHELGPVFGSYFRRSSIHQSSNRGVALHAVQGLTIADVVVHDVVGHGFYLEPAADSEYATRHNTLDHSLAMSIHGCGTLERIDGLRGAAAAGYYLDDPRNVLWANAAAGYDYAGFYMGLDEAMVDIEAPDSSLGCYHLCGDAKIDYATTASIPLDTAAAIYSDATYDASAYVERLQPAAVDPVDCVGVVETACHGTFRWNGAHSGRFGLWAEEHKTTLLRLNDFLTYKNEERGIGIKNKGFTELVRLLAADNATAVWPATHAYHLWIKPEFLVLDSHIAGLTSNTGASTPSRPWSATELAALRSLPEQGTRPIYGVEVYEGHLHVARTYFEGLEALAAAPAIDLAAFGRHQSFPFYTNDPHNSIQAVTIDATSNPMWFDPPEPQASGQSTVLLLDLDDSLGLGAGVSYAPLHDFILPGTQCVPAGVCAATVDASHVAVGTAPTLVSWNAYGIDGAEPMGQVIVKWCDDAQGCHHGDEPSRASTGDGGWIQMDLDIQTVDGLALRDATECGVAGACTSVLEAHHSVEGVHSHLGGNLVLGHDYLAILWSDHVAETPLVDVSPLSAIEVSLRGAPAGGRTCVTVPVADYPCEVHFTRGELDSEYRFEAATEVAAPFAGGEWAYAPPVYAGQVMVAPATIEACVDAAADREAATMTIITREETVPFLGDGVQDCLP